MKLKISTKGFSDIIDITNKVSEAVRKSKIKDGICLISCPGSTVGLTTIENDPNLLEDFKEFLEKIIPSDKHYRHDQTWGDNNGSAHLKSSIIKPFLTIPIEEGKLILGTWQQIVLIDFDNKPREREIIIKIIKH
jgi:secondary thiamine-phosphate synthase enzyme